MKNGQMVAFCLNLFPLRFTPTTSNAPQIAASYSVRVDANI